MIDDTVILPPSPAGEKLFVQQKKGFPLWERIALGAILLLSVFMDFFLLGQNGYGNLYYAAGVRSMADSWHNFFFVSFDPGGFVTIDKPPLGFWLQVISTKIFGFTAFSIFFPQALCGVLSVLLLYFLVRRHFGAIAGLIAALALAVTPISVVTNRNNTIDSTLALTLLLAAWAVIHAAETGKLRWLLVSALFVGLGFNIKMAEAYLVLPALVMTYLLCAPRKLWTRIWHLLLFLVLMFAISLSWAAAVDMTPVAQRPYVGSTQDNSEISLAFGYNGLSRLRIGNNGGFGGNNRTRTRTTDTNRTQQGTGSTSNQGSSGTTRTEAPPAFNAGAIFESGAPGPFRLWSPSLGGQIAWLLSFALLAILALAWQRRFAFQQDRQQLGLVLWGFWLLTMATFFSVDGSFHQYYMTEMAPGLSALVGIGAVIMWKDYRNPSWRGWLLPIALVITAASQIYMLASFPAWASWLDPLIAILTGLAVIGLLLFRLRPQWTAKPALLRVAGTAISLALLALLIAPTIWAGYSVVHNTENSFPTAGPAVQTNASNLFPGGRTSSTGRTNSRTRSSNSLAGLAQAFIGGNAQVDPALLSYLQQNQGDATFLVATPSSTTADSIILATNKPVMAMGGFSGNDPILTVASLQTLIHNGSVRFFLVPSRRAVQSAIDQLPEQYRELFERNGGFGGFGGSQLQLTNWIDTHCHAVPPFEWQSTSTTSGTRLNTNQLYDCASSKP